MDSSFNSQRLDIALKELGLPLSVVDGLLSDEIRQSPEFETIVFGLVCHIRESLDRERHLANTIANVKADRDRAWSFRSKHCSCEELRQQLASAESQARVTISVLERQLEAQQAKIEQQKQENENLVAKLWERDSEMSKVQGRLLEMEQQQQRLEILLKCRTNELETIMHSLKDANGRADAAQKSLQEANSRAEAYEERYRKEQKAYHEYATNSMKASEAKKLVIAKLESEKSSLMDLIEQLKFNEEAKAKIDVDGLQAKVVDISKKNSLLQSKLDMLFSIVKSAVSMTTDVKLGQSLRQILIIIQCPSLSNLNISDPPRYPAARNSLQTSSHAPRPILPRLSPPTFKKSQLNYPKR